jgi:predicted amidohydrolase
MTIEHGDGGAPTDTLRLTLVQSDTIWHDPEANRQFLAMKLRDECGCSDVVILPETFTTGFSNEAICDAETMEGPTVEWILLQARVLNAAMMGSLQIRDGSQVFNRLCIAFPNGTLLHYDKRHLFRMAGEHERYAAGMSRLVFQWRGWSICPLVCYDLRFPVFARNRLDSARGPNALNYDLLVYVANWPSVRKLAWETLLRARAIENLCYVAGVNRVGTDGNRIHYAGGSVVHNMLGGVVARSGEMPGLLHASLSLAEVRHHRRQFPTYLDGE